MERGKGKGSRIMAYLINPLNNLGFYVLLGLGAFVLVEFMNSSSGVALARSAPMMTR